MEWQTHGSFGARISDEQPNGNQYLVLPNAETAKWEVFLSRSKALFTRVESTRSFHTAAQAKAWAESMEVEV